MKYCTRCGKKLLVKEYTRVLTKRVSDLFDGETGERLQTAGIEVLGHERVREEVCPDFEIWYPTPEMPEGGDNGHTRNELTLAITYT